MTQTTTNYSSIWLLAAAFVCGALAAKFLTPISIGEIKCKVVKPGEVDSDDDDDNDEESDELTDLSNLSSSSDGDSDNDDGEEGKEEGEAEDDDDDERKKMILVVRSDLKMGTGKIAAQCSHATLGVYRKIVSQHKHHKSPKTAKHVNWALDWSESGCAKIAVKAKDEAEMNQVKEKVKQLGLPFYLVIDAGKTQIARNSATVLAVGPAPESLINQCTGHLKLL